MWFPDKNDPELERLAGIIFDLRRQTFLSKHYRHSHERIWETPEQEKEREADNERAIQAWDNDTRRLIIGEAKGQA